MPASVEGSLNSAYLAPNTFINKRDIRKRIFPRYNEQNLFDWALFTGRIKETENTRFNWFEHGYLYGYGEIITSSASAYTAGTKVTVVLKSASHQESGTKSAPKKGDAVMINGKRGWIQSEDKGTPNAHSFVIKPVLGTDNITGGGANALANAFLISFSAAASDGSGMPTGMIRKPDLYYNYTQIIKTQYKANGSESTNKSELELGGDTSGRGDYFYLQGVEDAANKHNLDISFAFFFEEKGDGTLTDDDNGDEPVSTTGGIDATIRDFGNPLTYTTFAYSDMKNVEKILSRERAPNQMMWMNGVNLDLDVNAVVKTEAGNYTGIDYSAFGTGDAAARAVDFGFDSFRFAKRTYHKKQEDFLNYKPVTGYTSAPWPNNAYILPIDRVANPNTKEDSDTVDTLCVRFKKNDRMNRYVKHWTRDVTITNVDQIEFNHMSEVGLQFAMLNQTIRLTQ